jgi:hypothetical protein
MPGGCDDPPGALFGMLAVDIAGTPAPEAGAAIDTAELSKEARSAAPPAGAAL